MLYSKLYVSGLEGLACLLRYWPILLEFSAYRFKHVSLASVFENSDFSRWR